MKYVRIRRVLATISRGKCDEQRRVSTLTLEIARASKNTCSFHILFFIFTSVARVVLLSTPGPMRRRLSSMLTSANEVPTNLLLVNRNKEREREREYWEIERSVKMGRFRGHGTARTMAAAIAIAIVPRPHYCCHGRDGARVGKMARAFLNAVRLAPHRRCRCRCRCRRCRRRRHLPLPFYGTIDLALAKFPLSSRVTPWAPSLPLLLPLPRFSFSTTLHARFLS